MIHKTKFHYIPDLEERETASNSYLMSLVILMGGISLPIVNVIATFFFWLANRKGTQFVRWHCSQALLSQFVLVVPNLIFTSWTVRIFLLSDVEISSAYIVYGITVLSFNLFEFIMTIITAMMTRKGIHAKWWLYSDVIDALSRKKNDTYLT